MLEEIGKIGLNPYIKEIDLAGFQGAGWAGLLRFVSVSLVALELGHDSYFL